MHTRDFAPRVVIVCRSTNADPLKKYTGDCAMYEVPLWKDANTRYVVLPTAKNLKRPNIVLKSMCILTTRMSVTYSTSVALVVVMFWKSANVRRFTSQRKT